jgi:hypothetical protein
MNLEQEIVLLAAQAYEDGSLANLKSVAIITALFAVFRKKQYRDTVLLMLKECAKWWLNRYRAGARNFRKDHPTISRSVGVGVAVLETTGSYALSVSLAVMALVVFYLTIPLAVQTARGLFGVVVVTSILLVGSLWYLFEAEQWRRKK